VCSEAAGDVVWCGVVALFIPCSREEDERDQAGGGQRSSRVNRNKTKQQLISATRNGKLLQKKIADVK
jgi:hypothetical protein